MKKGKIKKLPVPPKKYSKGKQRGLRRIKLSDNRKMKLIRRKRLLSKKDNKVEVRTLSRQSSEPYRFIVYFTKIERPWSQSDDEGNEIIAFVRGFANPYKIVTVKNKFTYGPERRLLDYVKLADESDLFSLMLCHRERVLKIFEIKPLSGAFISNDQVQYA